jgi:hypothetical protein
VAASHSSNSRYPYFNIFGAGRAIRGFAPFRGTLALIFHQGVNSCDPRPEAGRTARFFIEY